MAERSRGSVIARPASGFFEPVKFNLTKRTDLIATRDAAAAGADLDQFDRR
jgi:hypothetical protein